MKPTHTIDKVVRKMVQPSKLTKVGPLSIGRALLVLTSVFIVTLFGILLYTIITIQDQKLDGVLVDLAGRQRMLNQRHMKEILLTAQGLPADYPYTRTILNQTLDALMFGGPALVNLENRETLVLSPAPTPEILKTLGQQKTLLSEFTQKADNFLKLRSDHPGSTQERDALLGLNSRLHEVANKAVKLFSRYSQEKIFSMILWESLIGLLAIVLGVLLTRQVKLANRELEHEIHKRTRVEKALRYRIEIEKLVANLSTQFINLRPKDLDREINRALEAIGTFGEVDRSYVFAFEDQGASMSNTHEWCRSGIRAQRSRLQGLPLVELPWFEKQITSSPFIQISSVDQLPPEALSEKQEFQREGIKSLLNVPMVWQGALFGFLGFDSVKQEKMWSEEDIRLLQMAGEIFVNGFERKRVDENLRKNEEEKIEAFRQSDAFKTALLSLVSHELRTPLTAIKASAAGLMSLSGPDMPPVQREFLQGINQEIDFLNGLVENLLDMSRVEAGMLAANREWHLIEDLVEGAIRRLELSFENRSLGVDLGEDRTPVYVDSMEIQQVLINLLDNALKYSPPGSPISIVGRRSPGQVKVKVSNEGEGIPQEDVPKLFERFYRVKGRQARLIRGTGLGLAICKGIVEAHGGRIWVESSHGRGVTLGFSLPTSDAPQTIDLEQPVE